MLDERDFYALTLLEGGPKLTEDLYDENCSVAYLDELVKFKWIQSGPWFVINGETGYQSWRYRITFKGRWVLHRHNHGISLR